MTALRLVLGDQLSLDLSALADLDATGDAVLMMEVVEECRYVAHHKQKIVLVLAAMRHFAADLRRRGARVDYVRLDDPGNTGSFTGEVQRAVARHQPERIVMTEPGEWRVQAMVESWRDWFGRPVEIRDDGRFFASRGRFAGWARGRRTWRMEHFYREMRREHALLMDGNQPAGGRWNYDAANRRRLPKQAVVPARRRFTPDAITNDVIALVSTRFPNHFGALDHFDWPVTRAQAFEALEVS